MRIYVGNFKKTQKFLFGLFGSTLTGTPNLPVSFSVAGNTTGGSFPNAGIRYFQTVGESSVDFTGAEGWSQPLLESTSFAQGNVTWEADVLAPFSASNVMTITLKSGTYTNTITPWQAELDFSSATKNQAIYYDILFKLSPTWLGHGSGKNIVSVIKSTAASLTGSVGSQLQIIPNAVQTASVFPQLSISGSNDSRDLNNGGVFLPQINSSYQIQRGVWTRWEIFAQLNSYNSASQVYNSDGIIQSWITTEGEQAPTQIHNISNVSFDAKSTGSALFNALQHLYVYGGTGSSPLVHDVDIEFSRVAVYTGPAIFTTQSIVFTFNTASSPHASWALFGYTDFRTGNLSVGGQPQINLEQNFMAGHLDSIMSGPHTASYDVVGLKQIPYTLFFQSKIYDNGSDFSAWHSQATAFCQNRGLNEEDIYVHMVSGSSNFQYRIQYISSSGLMQLLDANPYAFVSATHLYVTKSGNINLDGTHSILGYSYLPTTASAGNLGQGILQIQLDSVGFSVGAIGLAQPPAGDGTKTPMNRLVGVNAPFFPPWWFMNPASSASLAFQTYRNNNLITGSNQAGVFCDSVQKDTFPGASVEFPTLIAYTNNLATHIVSLKSHFSGSIFRVNSSNFMDNTSSIIIDAAKSAHFEEYNNGQRAFWFAGNNNRGFLRQRVNNGCLIELVNSFGWDDTPSGGGGLYVNDFIPVGAKNSSTVRMKVMEYGQYLTCLQTGSKGGILPNSGGVIFACWNDEWDVSNLNAGVNSRWLKIWEYPIGNPLNDLTNILVTTDPAGQPCVIRQMDFQSASLFIRGNDSNTTTNFGDAAAQSFPLPSSSGSTGKWKRIQTDGTLSGSLQASASLRPSECILMVGV